MVGKCKSKNGLSIARETFPLQANPVWPNTGHGEGAVWPRGRRGTSRIPRLCQEAFPLCCRNAGFSWISLLVPGREEGEGGRERDSETWAGCRRGAVCLSTYGHVRWQQPKCPYMNLQPVEETDHEDWRCHNAVLWRLLPGFSIKQSKPTYCIRHFAPTASKRSVTGGAIHTIHRFQVHRMLFSHSNNLVTESSVCLNRHEIKQLSKQGLDG